MAVTVTFAGTGDAFGSGGRFNTCILVDAPGLRFAVDFGASSLIALERLGIDHTTLDAVLLTHLHADHGAGVPSLLLDSMIVRKRRRALTLAGPPGFEAWLAALGRLMYPGSDALSPRFPVERVALEPLRAHEVAGLSVVPYPAAHTPETKPTGLRIGVAGKVIAYTGDGAWTPHILDLARGADLLIAECYSDRKAVPAHMSHAALAANLGAIEAKRVVLTHLGPEMLSARERSDLACADDGMTLSL